MGPLGELERVVMEAVWDHPPATVREVADRAYTTVMWVSVIGITQIGERNHPDGHRNRDAGVLSPG
jgi:hypothetical protein